jgi:type I site-specific restriction endonuclease
VPDNSHEPRPDALSEEQQGRIKRRATDQDRTLLAMQRLEAALGTAAPHREQAWRDEVRTMLTVLGEAAREEADNAAQPDSLLSDIARTQPWLRNRVRGLRLHYRQLRDAIAALQEELDHPADQTVDFTDIRQRLAWLLAGLRHQRGRESDLIYEAYYDAVRSDIEQDADNPPRGRTR